MHHPRHKKRTPFLFPSGLLFTSFLFTACLPQSDPIERGQATYAGSDSCQTCHSEIHTRWQQTLMAKVLQDPRQEPNVILGNFEINDPLVTFSRDDIVFTYGSKWNNGITRRSEKTTSCFPHNGMYETVNGDAITYAQALTGGPNITRRTKCNDRPARCVMDATR